MMNKWPRSLDPWSVFLPAFPENCWMPDEFDPETSTVSRALQFSASSDADYDPDVLATVATTGSLSFLAKEPNPAAPAFNAESPPSLTRKPSLSPLAGKVSKRKPRSPSMKQTTTFIVADPDNFRQMVQQVTGNRFCGQNVAAEAVLKPDPRCARGRVALDGSCLPTLDTSAFFLERAAAAESPAAPGTGSQGSSGSGLQGPEFDMHPTFPCFPTLESWSPM